MKPKTKRSIALRLAAMFALAALVVFTLIGFLLYRVLVREVDRHQLEELTTTFQVVAYVVSHSHRLSHWESVRSKLDDLSVPHEGLQFWVWSDDPRFRYGKSLDEVGERLKGWTGIGDLVADEFPSPMKIQVGDFRQNGERPPLRVAVGMDSGSYIETRRAVAVALLALSAAGVVLVALLGYAIARLGLKPVNDLSKEAEDLTPKNLAQRLRLDRLPPELSKLGTSFNGALDRLEAAYQLLEAFNADVAHELRTPLANLIGQTQVALSRERTIAQLEETLQSNLEELERMRAIVNDMLFLTRADQGESALQQADTSVAEEVGKTIEFLDFLLEDAGVSVRVQGDARAPLEVSLFRRAMTNLLHNAIRHSPRGAEITVDIATRELADSAGSAVFVAVSNPGPEIAERHLPRIFDRFYRVESSRPNSRSSHGLGLSIVKAIATMHGGGVFASSRDRVTTVGFSVAGSPE